MKNSEDPAAGPAPHVGILLLSHGPLAEALRETVGVLEPDQGEPLGSLSLAWDEAPESASERLQRAIAKADQIMVLEHGRIVGLGPHAQLLVECPTYAEIVASQITVEEVAA